MSVIVLIARIMYAMIFIGSGSAGHMMQTEGTAAYAESRGIPNSRLLTQVSGVVIFLGGLAIALGAWLDIAALGMAVYSLIAGVMVHHFWTDDDPVVRQMEMSMFMKNLAIAGGGLAIFALAATAGVELGLTVTGPVVSLNW
jgi:uncharacterized membrane protein YphA (DoxX/SURF4 family)